jgi:uncharacterized protein
MISKQQVIDKYNMKPHPEGGFYAETYRSNMIVNTEVGPRSASTAIYFLLGSNCLSRFHRLAHDEMWHFYTGAPIAVVELVEETGGYKTTILGQGVPGSVDCEFEADSIQSIDKHQHHQPQLLQYVVKGGTWFASYPIIAKGDTESYTLVGCTVSPGFEFSDFELGGSRMLNKSFQAAGATGIIDCLTIGLL